MKKILLFLFIISNVYAQDCVNFNNITNENVTKYIAKELKKYRKDSYKNNKKCNLQIYLPIKVFINSTNQNSQIEVYIIYSKNNSQKVFHKFIMNQTDNQIYDFTQKEIRMDLKNNIIKKHSKLIADTILQL